MAWLEDVYKVVGVFVEDNSEKPAGGTAEEAANASADVETGVNPDGSTLLLQQQQAQNQALLKWGMIGGGVLLIMLIFVLMVRK